MGGSGEIGRGWEGREERGGGGRTLDWVYEGEFVPRE